MLLIAGFTSPLGKGFMVAGRAISIATEIGSASGENK